MKCLKGMKRQNKWMILIASVVFVTMTGFTQSDHLWAAEEEDMMTMEYLDPFELTTSSFAVSANSTDDALTTTTLSSEPTMTTMSSTSPYAQPLKIWIPYRPRFRSPCTPSW